MTPTSCPTSGKTSNEYNTQLKVQTCNLFRGCYLRLVTHNPAFGTLFLGELIDNVSGQ